MKKSFLLTFTALFIILFSSCSNATQGGTVDKNNLEDKDTLQDALFNQDTDETTDNIDEETNDADSLNLLDGYTVSFTIGQMNLMGSEITLATGIVQAVAREDLKTDENETITGECVFSETPPKSVKTCDSDADCPPDQRCRPKTDVNGKPIENSDQCITLNRKSLDIGTIEISGFTSGTEKFMFEPNDKVYKLNGEGDGKIDPSLMAYDVDYVVTGPKEPSVDGLGQITATGHLYSSLKLTEPAVVTGGMVPSIPIDTKKDLNLKWTSSDNKEQLVTINLTGKTGYISCRVSDTGELTISKTLLSKMTFATGMMAVQNTIEMIRHKKIPFKGEGVKAGTLDMEQRILLTMTPTD